MKFVYIFDYCVLKGVKNCSLYIRLKLFLLNIWCDMILFFYRLEDIVGYKCILEILIFLVCRWDEDRVIYLNKGKKNIVFSSRYCYIFIVI